MANNIEGLPEGAVVGPALQQSQNVEGLPEGATVGPALTGVAGGAGGSWEKESLWEKANKPLVPETGFEKQSREYSTSAPRLSELDHPIETGIKKGLSGVTSSTMKTARDFTSPIGIGLMAAAPAAKAAGAALPALEEAAPAVKPIVEAAAPYVNPLLKYGKAALGGLFAGQGAQQAVKGGTDIATHGATPENVEQTLSGTGQAFMGAGMGAEGTKVGELPAKEALTAPIRGAAKIATAIEPIVPYTAGALAGKEFGHPYIGSAVGRALYPKETMGRILEKGRVFGLPEDKAKLSVLKEKVDSAEKAFDDVNREREAYSKSEDQGVPIPEELQKRWDKAHTEFAEASQHYNIATQPKPAVPGEQTEAQALAQMKMESPTDAEINVRQDKSLEDLKAKYGIKEEPKPEVPAAEAPKAEVKPEEPAVKTTEVPAVEKPMDATTAGKQYAGEAAKSLGIEYPKSETKMKPIGEREKEAIAKIPVKEPIPEKTETGLTLGVPPTVEDTGAKVRGEEKGIPRTGERRAQPREEATRPEADRLFSEARKKLGEDASFEDIQAEVESQRRKQTGEKQAEEAKPEPGLVGAEYKEEGEKSAAEYHPAVREQVFSLSNANLDKLAAAHGLDPNAPEYARTKEMRSADGRHQLGREKMADDIMEQMSDAEKANIGRGAEALEHNPDMAGKAKAERAESLFPRLRGPETGPVVEPEAPKAEEPKTEVPAVEAPEKPYEAPKAEGPKPAQYDEAVRLVKEAGKGSTKVLREGLGIGAADAVKLLDRMEAEGVVGPAEGAAPREVLYGEKNKGVTTEAYEEAKKKFNEKTAGRMGGGAAFLSAVPEAAKMAAYHFEAGARTFADWSEKMLNDLGEEVRPHLGELWKKVNSETKAAADKVIDHVSKGDKPFAILTAENPGNKRLTDAENQTRNAELLKDLQDKGHKPVPIDGHTKDVEGASEHSFFVPGIKASEAAELGRRHGQASIVTHNGLYDLEKETVNPLKPEGFKTGESASKADYYSKVNNQPFALDFDFNKEEAIAKGGTTTVGGGAPVSDEDLSGIHQRSADALAAKQAEYDRLDNEQSSEAEFNKAEANLEKATRQHSKLDEAKYEYEERRDQVPEFQEEYDNQHKAFVEAKEKLKTSKGKDARLEAREAVDNLEWDHDSAKEELDQAKADTKRLRARYERIAGARERVQEALPLKQKGVSGGSAAETKTQTIAKEKLEVGDTFVDETGEPRRITAIEGDKIRTADGTLRTYDSTIKAQGDLNNPRALLAQGGKAHPPAAKPVPSGDDVLKKYGEAPDKDPLHTVFITKDGKGVNNTGIDHAVMVGGNLEGFVADGNIRVRPRSGGKGGREVALSIPESGITPDQLGYLKQMSPQMKSGAVMIEVGKTGGDYRTLEYGKATPEAIEKAVRELGPVVPEGYPKGEVPPVSGGAPGAAAAPAKETVKLPELAEKHLLPEERAGVTKTAKGAEGFANKLAERPELQEWVDAAQAGEGGRKWYQRGTAAFEAMMKEAPEYFKEDDRDKFLNFVASTSPQQTVAMNLKEALSTWAKYVDMGRPEGKPLESMLSKELTLPEAKVPNAMKAIAGEPMWPDLSKNENFKVPSFGANLRGLLDYVTNDGWMALFGESKGLGKPSNYHPLSVMTRAAAEKLNWSPAEAQAAIWAFTKTFTEHGETDPEQIRQYSEDFADIMANDPEVRSQLKELGVNLGELDKHLEAIGEKPQVSSRRSATAEDSLRKFIARLEKTRGEGAVPAPKTGLLGFGKSDETTEFNPSKFQTQTGGMKPVGKKAKLGRMKS